jgi:S1-C subfamily serine protease
MLRAACLIALSTLVLPGCLIVVDHDGESHWAHYEEVHNRRIGIYVESVGSTTASQLAIDADHTAVIERVVDGSPADQAGLKPHDIVTSVDGDTDASPSRVRHLIHSHKSGETVTFGVLRQGKSQTIAVTVK